MCTCTGILKPSTETGMVHFYASHTLVFLNHALKQGIVHFMCIGILKPGIQTRHTNQAYTHCISENYVPIQPHTTSTIIGQSVHVVHMYMHIYMHAGILKPGIETRHRALIFMYLIPSCYGTFVCPRISQERWLDLVLVAARRVQHVWLRIEEGGEQDKRRV